MGVAEASEAVVGVDGFLGAFDERIVPLSSEVVVKDAVSPDILLLMGNGADWRKLGDEKTLLKRGFATAAAAALLVEGVVLKV